MKGEFDKLDLNKIQNFQSAKAHVKRLEGHAEDWEKIFAISRHARKSQNLTVKIPTIQPENRQKTQTDISSKMMCRWQIIS